MKYKGYKCTTAWYKIFIIQNINPNCIQRTHWHNQNSMLTNHYHFPKAQNYMKKILVKNGTNLLTVLAKLLAYFIIAGCVVLSVMVQFYDG